MIELIPYAAAMALVAVGIYAVVTKENLIKKVIGLIVLTNGIHMFLISLGYRTGGIAPIMSVTDPGLFSLLAVDPLPQAMVLTSIVISLSISALALSIIIRVYRTFGTVDTKKLRLMKG
jgi:multicomponent Na+:H+ antiporter subunit C